MATRMTAKKYLATMPRVPSGRCYIVIGPGTWGKAFDAEGAYRLAGKPDKFLVYDAPPDCVIDDDGSSVYRPALYYVPGDDERKSDDFQTIGHKAIKIGEFKQ